MHAPASATLQHDALTRLEGIADWHLRAREDEHDGHGRLRAVRERAGVASTYDYDARGNLTAIVEHGETTAFEYDAQDRLVTVRDAAGAIVRYRYGANDRLTEIDQDGRQWRFEHDAAGRLLRSHAGRADTVVYRYDDEGRVLEARTSTISTAFEYDRGGRARSIAQTRDGVPVPLAFAYDAAGRLRTIDYGPTAEWCRVEYEWDGRGRPRAVRIGQAGGVRYAYDDTVRAVTMTCSNGVQVVSHADPIDARAVSRVVRRGADMLDERRYALGRDGRMCADGRRTWRYDEAGRLAEAVEGDRRWTYEYDARDRRCKGGPEGPPLRSSTDGVEADLQVRLDPIRDDRGRAREHGGRVFRYNDRDELTEVLRDGAPVVSFEYDHKGRLAASAGRGGVRRFVYGPSDELLAVTDERGRPIRIYVPSPFGTIAYVDFSAEGGSDPSVVFLHNDEHGTCLLATDAAGHVAGRFEYDPFGTPLSPDAADDHAFRGRTWCAEAGLYYFGARWYDPAAGAFLTRDTWTARPDDQRLVNAVFSASGQRSARAWMLGDWLRHPRSRNPWAFCGHDPVGSSDPNGHWSFGGVLLSILGAIWTLPNTIFGILIEITCLIGEVIRWIVWLVTGGNVSWATPGFDVAASGRLNAFALVFRGGWLGSFSSLLGITFGNVFFVYHDWENNPELSGGGTVSPPAYGGTETFPKSEALYEHELRHTNQYAWFGPFFHLGLPIWGVYVWDVIFNGYEDSWCERDARNHAF